MSIFYLLIAIFIASLGFAALGLSQTQHWRRIPRDKATKPPAWLRPTGWVLVFVSYVPAMLCDGVAFGALLWVGLLSMAAICVVVILQGYTKLP